MFVRSLTSTNRKENFTTRFPIWFVFFFVLLSLVLSMAGPISLCIDVIHLFLSVEWHVCQFSACPICCSKFDSARRFGPHTEPPHVHSHSPLQASVYNILYIFNVDSHPICIWSRPFVQHHNPICLHCIVWTTRNNSSHSTYKVISIHNDNCV